MKPVVAIPQMGNDLFRKYMKSKYTKSLERAGAEVKWIELDDKDKAVQTALRCDALLLPGGADVAPQLYGQTPLPECGKPNVVRDSAEPLILKAFLEAKKPIFAICRGVQILNVYFGGTLKQDIKAEQQYKHMDFMSRARSIHPVDIEKNSVLFTALGTEKTDVNSMHHQVIDKVGDNLHVTAVSPDGYVEALELDGCSFCVGVQWHPEHMSKKNRRQQKLFDLFVERAREN